MLLLHEIRKPTQHHIIPANPMCMHKTTTGAHICVPLSDPTVAPDLPTRTTQFYYELYARQKYVPTLPPIPEEDEEGLAPNDESVESTFSHLPTQTPASAQSDWVVTVTTHESTTPE